MINKWVREERGSDYFTHQEGIKSIDYNTFKAKNLIQEGEEVENIGILVAADNYEDRAKYTSNMPAKTTLYNYAWERDEGFLSSAEVEVRQADDVLVPTRYFVNSYKSVSSEPGSSVKFGYTIINANSDIMVSKDKKEDVVVEENHTRNR